MSPRLWSHRIQDILEAIAKIQDYTRGFSLGEFERDAKTADAVVRNLIVIGEAARHMPEEIVARHPDIPWRLMADLRNLAVHEYFGVRLVTIWQTLREDLPPLVPLLERLLALEGHD